MSKTTPTECGEILTHSIIKLDAYVPGGHMIAALFADEATWVLLYMQGGDYNAFIDGDELIRDQLQDWVPDAILDATEQMIKIFGTDEVCQDMDWFQNWAERANETLKEEKEEDEKKSIA